MNPAKPPRGRIDHVQLAVPGVDEATDPFGNRIESTEKDPGP